MSKNLIEILKRCIKPIGKVLSILSIIFVIYSVYKLGFDFDSITDIKTFVVIVIFGVTVKIFSVILAGSAWSDWLKLFAVNKNFNRKEAIKAYSKANIGKYLPGNVMHYVERNLFATGLGLSQKRIALGSAAEIVGQLLSAFIMGFIMAYAYFLTAVNEIFKGKNVIYIVVIFVLLVIAFICMAVFRKKIMNFVREFGAKAFVKTFFVTLIKYILSLWLLGFIMVVLYGYMGGHINSVNFKIIIAGYIIAWVLGFVTPGASGGIGVRELVIILLLKEVVGEELILTLSVIHRLITIVGDFLLYFAVIFTIGKGEAKK